MPYKYECRIPVEFNETEYQLDLAYTYQPGYGGSYYDPPEPAEVEILEYLHLNGVPASERLAAEVDRLLWEENDDKLWQLLCEAVGDAHWEPDI